MGEVVRFKASEVRDRPREDIDPVRLALVVGFSAALGVVAALLPDSPLRRHFPPSEALWGVYGPAGLGLAMSLLALGLERRWGVKKLAIWAASDQPRRGRRRNPTPWIAWVLLGLFLWLPLGTTLGPKSPQEDTWLAWYWFGAGVGGIPLVFLYARAWELAWYIVGQAKAKRDGGA